MSDDDDNNVTRLPISFKEPPGDRTILKVVTPWEQRPGGCDHRYIPADGLGLRRVQYLIRDGETEVECGFCNTKLDPMWVLKQLALRESEWNRSRKAYQEEMARLNERQKTKCQHCGKMTRISHR